LNRQAAPKQDFSPKRVLAAGLGGGLAVCGLLGAVGGPALALAFLAGAMLVTGLALMVWRRTPEMAERRTASLADLGPDLILHHGTDGRLLHVSPASLALVGRTPESLTGTAPEALFHAHDRPLVRAALARACYRGEAVTLEAKMRHRDGRNVWVELRINPIPAVGRGGARAKGYEIVTSVRDITAHKAREAALERARREAEAASAAKSRFLAGMSHELRTPLNAILGFSEVMANEMFGAIGNPRYREYARHIHDSGLHLKDMIDDVLDLSKIEAGKFEIAPEILSVPQLFENVLKTVAITARKHGVTLDVELPHALPPLVADRRAMRQILLNLLSNAVKFTPAGGRVTVTAALRGSDYVIEVRDTGIGIPKNALERIGRPFEQVREGERAAASRHAGDVKGTGLGLALVKALVAMHAGTLAIASEEGAGTTVTIALPLAARPSETAPAAEPDLAAGAPPRAALRGAA
jgi:cell cycle sensor histidine kinase DivJ